MRAELQEKAAMFQAVNEITMRGEIVVFGSSFMANFPFYELSKKYVLENAVYNRSINDLTVTEAESVLNECVLNIKPGKVFLALGETEEKESAALAAYARILKKIKAKLPQTQIYILPVISKNEDSVYEFNEKLRTLSEQQNARFLSVLSSLSCTDSVYEKLFKQLHRFFRSNHLNFAQAFALAH